MSEMRLMTAREVAYRLNVSTKTLQRWEAAGVLVPVGRTPGGYRRYRESDIPWLPPEGEDLLTRAEVAVLFGVSPLTVSRWTDAGKLTPVVLPGERLRRYRASQVWALLNGEPQGPGTEVSR